MRHSQFRIFAFVMVLMLALPMMSGLNKAEAAGEIYVNNGQNVLDISLGSAYAIGANGEVSKVSGRYAITGNGVVEVGQGTVTDPGDDGSTIKVKNQIVKVGLAYYYSSGRDTALEAANLENGVGSGYQFGYFDEARSFVPTGSTTQTKITMQPSGNGQGVAVTQTGTDTVLHTFDGSAGSRLAVRPISNSTKAETWFKGERYYGAFEYYRYTADKLTVISVLPLEDYIKGVIPSEMSATWPLEALKAQALCARTYYASSSNSYGRYGFDVTADTYSQAYQGTRRASANSNAAVDATAGKYITYGGKMISALYSSSSGGGTEDSENVWGNALPYLRGVIDPYEADVPQSINGKKSWRVEWSGEVIAGKLGNKIGTVVSAVPEYSRTGNCIKITFTDANGASTVVSQDSCRTTMGLNSIHYTVQKSGDNFVFEGGGWGHNLGMSQFGAYSMAKNHSMNYRQIISFYFAGVKISTGVM